MDLVWHGPVRGQSGYEVVTRGILESLDKLGIRIRLDESFAWNQERVLLRSDVQDRLSRMLQTAVAVNTPVIMHQCNQFPDLPSEMPRYIYTLFETNHLPKAWLKDLQQADGVFTFSHFNRSAWIEDGVDANKIHVLPFGVDPIFTPEGEKANIVNTREFVFISNGDFTERKNFEALIVAYIREFKANEPVTLLLKTHYGGFTKLQRHELLARLSEFVQRLPQPIPQILFFGDKITDDDMARLYRRCDCYVTASRGEGLGLPVIEAMACGLPVIATEWSALTELEYEGWHVPCTVDTIDCVDYIRKCPNALNHKWATIDLQALQKAMRAAFQDKERSKRAGEANGEQMKGRTWHDAALQIIQVVSGKGGL